MTHAGLPRTVAQLNAEWAVFATTPVPPAWVIHLPPNLSCGCPADLLEAVRHEPDAVLLALLAAQAAAPADDHRAGRVVVQAMVGKLVLMAVRDAEASFDEYLAALWERIVTYPVERRPRRVAANLALDTLKSVKATRPRAVITLPAPTPDPLADATTVLDAGVRLGAIDPLTRRTLEAVYVDGRTSRDAALVLGMSADTVRWRCSKGVKALRGVAGQLVAQLA